MDALSGAEHMKAAYTLPPLRMINHVAQRLDEDEVSLTYLIYYVHGLIFI